jgi:hypothetical protein
MGNSDKNKRLSNRKLHSLRTYDPHSLSSRGGEWVLYDDGHVSVDYRTCWQGERTGERYVTPAGYVDVSPEHPDDDYESRLLELVNSTCQPWTAGSPYRQTRQGIPVR